MVGLTHERISPVPVLRPAVDATPMSLPRFRLRTLMIAVAVVAVASYSAITANRVRVDVQGRWLYHLWERRGLEGYHRDYGSMHPAPFWPRYWRRLLGR